MKSTLLAFALLLAPAAPAAAAGVALQDFSNVVALGTTFYGSWGAPGSVLGSANPNSQFLQGVGVFEIKGSAPDIPTNSFDSQLRFDFAAPVDLGSNNQIAITAQLLPGNMADSFSVVLLANGNQAATTVFSTGSFSAGAYSTVTATLSFNQGFNPAQVDTLIISGVPASSSNLVAAFAMSFDHLAAVPEPAVWSAALGAVALCAALRHRRRR